MRDPLQPFLAEHGIILLDGALATELERRGANLDDPLWSAKLLLEAPDRIEQVHAEYFAAGADVAISASYQATFAGFAQRGLTETQAADLMRLSVRLAAAARDRFWTAYRSAQAKTDDLAGPPRLKPLVAASIGPYGAYLADGSEYRGDYGLSVHQLVDFHRPRLRVLAETVRAGQADLLACETIPCLTECAALVQLLAEFPNVPAWLSFSCCDGEHVCHGERLVECAALAAQSDQVVAVGVNCTPPQFVPSLLHHARSAVSKPLLAYPNSGETWLAAANAWAPDSATCDLARAAGSWIEAGARLVGGCCRTTPADIQHMRRSVYDLTLR